MLFWIRFLRTVVPSKQQTSGQRFCKGYVKNVKRSREYPVFLQHKLLAELGYRIVNGDDLLEDYTDIFYKHDNEILSLLPAEGKSRY